MKIKFLGTHNSESKTSKQVTFLIDEVFAVEAGCLTSQLNLAEQAKIGAVLLSHGHYDHIKDIPALAFNRSTDSSKTALEVIGTAETLRILESHLMDGLIYPEFAQSRSYLGRAIIHMHQLELYQPQDLLGFRLTALPVNHPLQANGFAITSADGKSVLYTGDTGPGLAHLWQQTSPELLVAETTFPNRLKGVSLQAGHLCPETLKDELIEFKRIKHYLPRIILAHIYPEFENEILGEVKTVAQQLDASISIAVEGQIIEL